MKYNPLLIEAPDPSVPYLGPNVRRLVGAWRTSTLFLLLFSPPETKNQASVEGLAHFAIPTSSQSRFLLKSSRFAVVARVLSKGHI